MTDLVKRLWRDAERNAKVISRARGVDMPPAETLEGQAALHLKQLEAENASLKADKAELVEGMKPFKERADSWENNTDAARVSVRLGDLRRAASLVAKHGGR